MNKARTPVPLTSGVALLFLLTAYQFAVSQQVQYRPDLGDDAGATCCIGYETCDVQENPPRPSCFYAVDNGALQTWYQCVAVTCAIWPNTTCWADATKARHEMGWDGAYQACDYDSSYGKDAGGQCCAGPACDDSCINKEFYACVSDRCRIWDGSSGDCEMDADMFVHQRARDCVPPGGPTPAPAAGPPLSCAVTQDKLHYDILESGTYSVRLLSLAHEQLQWITLCAEGPGVAQSCWEGLAGKSIGDTGTLTLTKGGQLILLYTRTPPTRVKANARFDTLCGGNTKSSDYVGFDARGGLRAGFRFTRIGP